ncbi:excinuclease ABC subunit UvrA [Nocardioidaceae bacterium]|nr:excinuclease ABC subunit UvrA [Nocardioidaceae bacterium]
MTAYASSPHAVDDGCVRVRGASEHNLRDVDVDLPRDAFVAFTGVSGSGKSSLAFGTLYAEAQRRYFESVSPYARQMMGQVGAPHVEEISGLPPAVALQQRRAQASARSSVGTITTLSNLLRILYSRAGDYPGGPAARDHDHPAHLPAEAFSPNTVAGACPACGGLGETHDVAEDLMVPDPSRSIREGAIAAWPGAWQGKNLLRIAKLSGVDIDAPWREVPRAQQEWLLFTDEQPTLRITREDFAGDPDATVGRDYNGQFWSARRYVRHILADSGSERQRAKFMAYVRSTTCHLCGGAGIGRDALAVTFAGHSIAALSTLPLVDLAAALAAWEADPGRGPGRAQTAPDEAATRIVADLRARIAVLVDLGLGYLALARRSTTLSPGEMQRLRIATQLRSGLFGVVYVLDEPSAGLHPADAEPLMRVLDALKAAGNTLFVVEHDMDVVRRADHVVDIGPGAGEAGGTVLYSGPVEGLEQVDSPTSDHLFDRAETLPPRDRAPVGRVLLRGVRRHNLDSVDVTFGLGQLTAVTGVSGSGKSTLVTQVLAGAVRDHLAGSQAGAVEAAEGLDQVDRLVVVDQKPIGRTPRSNLATYTGLFDAVRRAFADTEEARRRGYDAGRFSFNTPEGRCETCQGEGFVSVELMFLPGTYAPCSTCGGSRYDAETLEVRLDVTPEGLTIANVLDLTVERAGPLLGGLPAASRALAALEEVGLGYLRLGQPATELSGGEAQRIKLATELQRVRRGHTLYLLDEPTSGLHPSDAALLVRQLHRLVDEGDSVVVVEHDLATIATADHLLDLGPGGGDRGGRVVASGRPRDVAEGDGATARHLAAHLARRGARAG